MYKVRGRVYDSLQQQQVDIWYAGGIYPHRIVFNGQHNTTLIEGYATEFEDQKTAMNARDLMDGSRRYGQTIHAVLVEG